MRPLRILRCAQNDIREGSDLWHAADAQHDRMIRKERGQGKKNQRTMNVQVELAPQNNKGGLLLKNPVMTAAGTFGYGIELAKIAEIEQLGAIICKGITLHHRS